jgi:thiamine-monophosphate kinase
MEFDLIDRIRKRATARGDVILGIGDDAALLRIPEGHDLVVATDALNVGVHFPRDTAPADIGWKALAVNLSDLAAMGARPAWCTLALSLPQPDATWLDGFLDGFAALAAQHDMALVTGTLGDAAAALAQLQAGGVADPALRLRLDRPEPRVGFALTLAEIAHACIDLSDGLLQDLGHVCTASGVGARIDVDALPASPALSARSRGDTLRGEQACGGDDYELCFTAPPDAADAVREAAATCLLPVTKIGRVVAGSGVIAQCADGSPWRAPRSGYAHFA